MFAKARQTRSGLDRRLDYLLSREEPRLVHKEIPALWRGPVGLEAASELAPEDLGPMGGRPLAGDVLDEICFLGHMMVVQPC